MIFKNIFVNILYMVTALKKIHLYVSILRVPFLSTTTSNYNLFPSKTEYVSYQKKNDSNTVVGSNRRDI